MSVDRITTGSECRQSRWMALALVLTGLLAGCQTASNPRSVMRGTAKSGVVLAGHARFTIITPECIRMEYSPDNKFVDEPSIFAAARQALTYDRRETGARGNVRPQQKVTIQTGRIELQFINDGKPFNSNNLRAFVSNAGGPVEWRPGTPQERNLGGWEAVGAVGEARSVVEGGTSSTAHRELSVSAADTTPTMATEKPKFRGGMLSRNGWFVYDDSEGPILANGKTHQRVSSSGALDWFFFGYGDDMRAGFKARVAVRGEAELPLRTEIGSLGWLEDPGTDATSHSQARAAAESSWISRVAGIFRDSGGSGVRRKQTLDNGGLDGLNEGPWQSVQSYGLEKVPLFERVPRDIAAGNSGLSFWVDAVDWTEAISTETRVRELQFACLSPGFLMLERRGDLGTGGDLSMERDVADVEGFTAFRAQRMPYIYSQVVAVRQGLPLARPLYLRYAGTEEAFANPQEFLIGDNLLFAPITREGVGPGRVAWQCVWLPPGTWYNVCSGERFAGERTIVAGATLDEAPVFARGGVPLVMQPAPPESNVGNLSELMLRVYPGEAGADEDGHFTFYEDDGSSLEYMQDRSATTEMSYSRSADHITVTVSATRGSYDGQLRRRSYVVEFAGTVNPSSAAIDGKTVKAEYDPDKFTTRVRVAARSIRKGVKITLDASDADQSVIRNAALARRLAAAGVGGDADAAGGFSETEIANGTAEAALALLGTAVIEIPRTEYSLETTSPSANMNTENRASWRLISAGAAGNEAQRVRNVLVSYELRRTPDERGELTTAVRLTGTRTVADIPLPTALPSDAGPGAEIWRVLQCSVDGRPIEIRHRMTPPEDNDGRIH